MTNQPLNVDGFISPHFHLEEQVLYYIMREQTRRLVRRYLEVYQPELSTHSHGLIEFLFEWLGDDQCTFASCWHDSFGQFLNSTQPAAHDAALRDSPTLVSGVAMALHLNAQGYAASWRVDLKLETSCRFGPWNVPSCERILFWSNGSSAVLETCSGNTSRIQEYSKVNDVWELEARRNAHFAYFGTNARSIAILSNQDVTQNLRTNQIVSEVTHSTETKWQSAWQLICVQAPMYEKWVDRIVQSIVLLNKNRGFTISASYRYLFGLVQATAQTSKLSIAEILVHEASHQYFYLLRLIGDIDDGSDQNLYYSPLVNKNRPIERILFSYHACFNILCFYHLCMTSRADEDGYCEKHEPIVRKQLETLALSLRSNTALTPHGRLVFESMEQEMISNE